MKYDGIELMEMVPENWNGKTRKMIVWNPLDTRVSRETIIGYEEGADDTFCWIDHYGKYWNHCAEIPVEEKEDVMKLLIDNENKILELKAENKELKEKIKSLQVERSEMARDVSRDIDDELNERSVYKHFNQNCPGLAIAIITELVRKKILEYMSDSKPKKKLRRMTNKELDEWLEQGKGVVRIADHIKNTITYDCEDRNHEVSSYYKICGYDEDAWHEPLIEE